MLCFVANSLQFVLDTPIGNASSLVQVMAWHCSESSHYLNQRCHFTDTIQCHWATLAWYRWLSARLQYLQCISNGDYCSLALSHRYSCLVKDGRVSEVNCDGYHLLKELGHQHPFYWPSLCGASLSPTRDGFKMEGDSCGYMLQDSGLS